MKVLTTPAYAMIFHATVSLTLVIRTVENGESSVELVNQFIERRLELELGWRGK